MNHLERGGATVYDDGFAICAEIYSSAGNGLLLRDLERSFFSMCNVAISLRMVASEAPVRLHISITVTTGRS